MDKCFVVIDMQPDFAINSGIRTYDGDDFVVGAIRDTHYNPDPQTQHNFPAHCITN